VAPRGGGGGGGGGLAANLPYALLVLPADEPRARELLDLLPAEEQGEGARDQRRRWPAMVAVLLLVIAGAVLISAADRLFEALLP
jgi:hypothetical protein